MEVSSSALFNYLLEDLYGSVDAGTAMLQQPNTDYFPGASVQDVFKLRLVNSFYKKLVDVTADTADQKCLEKFHASNEKARNWQLKLQTTKDEELAGGFQQAIDEFFYPESEPLVQSIMDVFIRGRPGPGASLGANGEDFYTKFFSSRLSATSPSVYSMYLEGVLWYSDWRNAEFNRLLAFGLPSYSPSNRLSFVRKTRDVSRSICTEPSLNMFFQLGLGEIIGDRLKSCFGISLSGQPERNKHLACRGSLDGSIVTIDLESASDSMSNSMSDRFFPEFLKDLLVEFRCSSSVVCGEKVALHMVSTMGNGFTFPLQTAVFACVVRAVARWHRVHLEPCDTNLSQQNWGVFGDDIICPREIAGDVCRLLNILGFTVNRSKSYFIGPFRESCGGDFFSGVNVRGVYLKTLLTQEARYVAINALNEWTARSGILLQRTVGYLKDSVRDLAVPPWAPPDSGIRLPSPPPGLWSSKHQRYYYRCREPVPVVLSVSDGIRLLSPSNQRRPVRRRFFNPEGLEFSFLGGYVRNMEIVLPLKQGESPPYRTRTRVSPFWGPSFEQVRFAPDPLFWERWKTAASLNLSEVHEV